MAGIKKILRPPTPTRAAMKGCLATNALTLATMAGVVVGVILGVVLNSYDDEDDGWTPRQVRRKGD